MADGEVAAVTIRRATKEDQPTIVLFNQAMAKETEGIDIPDQVAAAGVAGVLGGAAQESAVYWLIQEEQQVVGQLMITLEWSDWRGSFVWWIQSVYVVPSSRGRGHFKRLYAHVRDEAQRQGNVAGLRLYADDNNKSAHATYEKLGMTTHYKVFEDMFTSY